MEPSQSVLIPQRDLYASFSYRPLSYSYAQHESTRLGRIPRVSLKIPSLKSDESPPLTHERLKFLNFK